MTRVERRAAALVAVFVVVVLTLGLLTSYLLSKRQPELRPGAGGSANEIAPPEFLYSFSGPEYARMRRPLGVVVDGSVVLVTDGLLGNVGVYSLNGRLLRTFGEGTLGAPLYITEHPTTGEYWVSDRRRGTIAVFGPSGSFLRDFVPTMPPPAEASATAGAGWSPAGLAFDGDGTLYVTDLASHRLLVFAPDGSFERSSGRAGTVSRVDEESELFSFPNGVKVGDGRVWVADSNNRRVKVCTPAGECETIVRSDDLHLPRGLELLPAGGAGSGPATRAVVMDAFGHNGLIVDAEGARLASFGERGVLDGQFANPNDVAASADGRLFITDTANARVQVWGWPDESPLLAGARASWWWWLAGLALLALPLLWLALRPRRFLATRDFVEAMLASGEVPAMPGRRRRWFAEPDVCDAFAETSQDDVWLSDVLTWVEHSESDAAGLMKHLGVDRPSAVTLAIAGRMSYLCTEDPELRRTAEALRIEVVDAAGFVERFTRPEAPIEDPPA